MKALLLEAPKLWKQIDVPAPDKPKPGGVMLALTSRYTLDRGDDKIRQALAAKGHLIQAFRLPENAFAKNAHTEVVTDLLIIQKKAFPHEPTPEYALPPGQWVHAGKETFVDEKGESFNEYVNIPCNAVNVFNLWKLSEHRQHRAAGAVVF